MVKDTHSQHSSDEQCQTAIPVGGGTCQGHHASVWLAVTSSQQATQRNAMHRNCRVPFSHSYLLRLWNENLHTRDTNHIKLPSSPLIEND